MLAPLLAACGGGDDVPKAGDLIPARLDNQFRKAHEVDVTLPTGRLVIHSGKPVDSASADETRTRKQVDAPSGAVLVPISWQYDTWGSERLDYIFDTDHTPIVDLVSGDEHYRLTPPERGPDGSEAFYVVVDGAAEDRSLEITFDGVAQTVDLKTGDREEGDAAGLYAIQDVKLKRSPCDKHKWFTTDNAAAEFSCDVAGPVLTPYAAGKWAPDGSTWLAMTVTTEIRVYGETDRVGGGARYLAESTKVKATIDGDKPDSVASSDDAADVCPVIARASCGWSKRLIFEVPADDGEQGPLDLDISYKLQLANAWNGYKAEKRKVIKAEQKLPLWK